MQVATTFVNGVNPFGHYKYTPPPVPKMKAYMHPRRGRIAHPDGTISKVCKFVKHHPWSSATDIVKHIGCKPQIVHNILRKQVELKRLACEKKINERKRKVWFYTLIGTV